MIWGVLSVSVFLPLERSDIAKLFTGQSFDISPSLVSVLES